MPNGSLKFGASLQSKKRVGRTTCICLTIYVLHLSSSSLKITFTETYSQRKADKCVGSGVFDVHYVQKSLARFRKRKNVQRRSEEISTTRLNTVQNWTLFSCQFLISKQTHCMYYVHTVFMKYEVVTEYLNAYQYFHVEYLLLQKQVFKFRKLGCKMAHGLWYFCRVKVN